MSAAVFVGFLVLPGAAYWRDRRASMRISRPLLALLLALVVAGVGFDALHVAFRAIANTTLVLLEDGGELLVVSATCWFAFREWAASSSSRRPPVPGAGARADGLDAPASSSPVRPVDLAAVP